MIVIIIFAHPQEVSNENLQFLMWKNEWNIVCIVTSNLCFKVTVYWLQLDFMNTEFERKK
jgi:hypothetical protein